MSDKCYFMDSSIGCTKTGVDLITAGGTRIQNVITASKTRGDNVHVQLEKELQLNEDLNIICHKSCVSTYTSSLHISRLLRKCGITESSQRSHSEPPLTRRRCGDGGFIFLRNTACFVGMNVFPRMSKTQDGGVEG